ncbi:MAG: YfbK domain-containing protein, partial [Gammaproteobacteria bacterium]
LVEQLSGTLQTIASDVKIQVEFNPAAVAEYRLIGYENRLLRREDFNNDRIDAGDIGAGHTVTALYELTLVGSPARLVDPLRYGKPVKPAAPIATTDELALVRLRYKAPDGDASRLIEQAVRRAQLGQGASEDMRFAAAVAAFGQKLRGGEYLDGFGYGDIAKLAGSARGDDPSGYRGEFLGLVRLADSLAVATTGHPGPSDDPTEGAQVRR